MRARPARIGIPVTDCRRSATVTAVERRIDRGTGIVWVGTSAADAVLSFDPRTQRFVVYELPSKGALVRHLAIDTRTHEVWVAYGASLGIPARVARLRPR